MPNKPDSLTIRPYTNSDWARVCAIHDAARHDELGAAGLADAYLTLAETAENEGFHDYNILVAEYQGQVAGFTAFTADELAWLYVDPAYYRRGIGRALIHAVLQINQGPVTAEVLEGNRNALASYQQAGFVEVGRAHGRMPGNEAFAVTVRELRHPGVR